MSSPIVQAELLEETQQPQQQPQECGETCDCSRCYDEADAEEDVANMSFHTESKFTFKVNNEKGQTLTFTVFDGDDDEGKKVHVELSEPMTLPLHVLQGYVNEIAHEETEPEESETPCSTLIAVLSLFLLSVFLTGFISYVGRS